MVCKLKKKNKCIDCYKYSDKWKKKPSKEIDAVFFECRGSMKCGFKAKEWTQSVHVWICVPSVLTQRKLQLLN